MDERLRKVLEKSGMPTRIQRSTVEGITPEIKAMLPGKGGFGLLGPVGSGKTGAVAATVIAMIEKDLERVVTQMEPWFDPREGTIFPSSPLCWISWPETVNHIRVLSNGDQGIGKADEIVRRMARSRWLVLDDLGAERIRGDYADDWATTQLDLVIDERYNELRPIWFTTSLTKREFGGRYGRRMIDRLAPENPMIEVGQIESRRLA